MKLKIFAFLFGLSFSFFAIGQTNSPQPSPSPSGFSQEQRLFLLDNAAKGLHAMEVVAAICPISRDDKLKIAKYVSVSAKSIVSSGYAPQEVQDAFDRAAPEIMGYAVKIGAEQFCSLFSPSVLRNIPADALPK